MLGGVVGGLLGVLGMVQGAWGIPMVLALFAGAWLVCFVIPWVASGLGGRAARVLYAPGGGSGSRKPGFSQAESLAARGMFEEGVAAFERAIEDDPKEPRPYLSIARIYRDKMRRYDDAALWFKRTLDRATLVPESRAFVSRELVELYVGKLDAPARAAPILARLLEEQPGTAAGRWANAELLRIKSIMADERSRG